MNIMRYTIPAILLLTVMAVGCKKQEPAAPDTAAQDTSIEADNAEAGNADDTKTQDNAADKDPAAASKDSIYVTDDVWTDHANNEVTLKDFEGNPVLIAMIYTHCGHACPMMVSNILAVQEALPTKLRETTQIVLVTLDSDDDTPEVLSTYADKHGLDEHWTLLHGDKEQTRTMSMLLDIQYSQLDNGHFSHSNLLTVLDSNGAIIEQFEGLEAQTLAVVDAVKKDAQ